MHSYIRCKFSTMNSGMESLHTYLSNRLVPIASTSSMNIMQGAFSLASWNASRTSFAPSPINICAGWKAHLLRKPFWRFNSLWLSNCHHWWLRSSSKKEKEHFQNKPFWWIYSVQLNHCHHLMLRSSSKKSPGQAVVQRASSRWHLFGLHKHGPWGSFQYQVAHTAKLPLEAGYPGYQTAPCVSWAAQLPP